MVFRWRSFPWWATSNRRISGDDKTSLDLNSTKSYLFLSRPDSRNCRRRSRIFQLKILRNVVCFVRSDSYLQWVRISSFYAPQVCVQSNWTLPSVHNTTTRSRCVKHRNVNNVCSRNLGGAIGLFRKWKFSMITNLVVCKNHRRIDTISEIISHSLPLPFFTGFFLRV